MRVGLLLVTHEGVGRALLVNAERMLGGRPLETRVVEAGADPDLDALSAAAEAACEALDTGAGVLVLTDLYGATPSNAARRLAARPGRRVVAGLSLPMLVRVLNYPGLPLEELAQKALSGGRDGVLLCDPPEEA